MSFSHSTSGGWRAEAAALIRAALALPLSDANRPIRLRFAMPRDGRTALPLDGLLLVQRIDIQEGLFEGLTAHITCISAIADLPLASFIGVPIEVQLVTDRGALRRFCSIVTEARAGQADGGLAVFQLTGRDALAVMERRTNSRVFRQMNPVSISRVMLREWLQRSPSLARAFDFDLSRLTLARYPDREFTMQHNESDSAFLRRTWRRAGIGWVIRPCDKPNEAPRHDLVLFDDAMRLSANAAGELRFHRDAATEERDGVTQWAPARKLVPARTIRQSWDYLATRGLPADEMSNLDQGTSGSALASCLQDSAIELPHAGANWHDHRRLTHLRMLRHEFEGGCVHGLSGVRDLAAGEWNIVSGHVSLERLPVPQREYVITDVQHWGENNLPKQLDERAQSLLAGSSVLPGWRNAAAPGGSPDRRYQNRFTAVRRDLPLVPEWNPSRDLPPTPPITARVVGPKNEEVHCDALGRVKVRFFGLDPADHDHAQGAGTEGTDRDSAWVRVDFGWAGAGIGNIQPLRVGMEVEIEFLAGDPDRPLITGVLYNADNTPPRFSDKGGLPGNRYLSGIKTREIKGRRYNQLRFDDTTAQISAQLASEHGQSQLNLGYLTHPREGGAGDARGEGFELRSDESGTIRTAKALLVSAWKRLDARSDQLDADEHVALMEDCLELFKTLGHYAADHQGLPLDPGPQIELSDAIRDSESGSNIDSKGPAGGKPTLSLTAPEGIAVSTPKSLVSFAGVNIDTVAQQHMQVTAGQRFNLNAGKGIGLFAREAGINAIAHRGKFLLQSQHDDIEANAANNIRWTATNGSLVGTAKKIVLIAEDGSFIQIGDGITLGTEGVIAQKAASFPHSGPETRSTELPSFAASTTEEVRELDIEYVDADGETPRMEPISIDLADGQKRSLTLSAGKASLSNLPRGPLVMRQPKRRA